MANNNNVPNSVLPLPPLEYDTQYFNSLVRQLNYIIQQQANPGQMRGATLTLTNLPTSAAGLPSGSIWNNAGILNIVP
jgi:hypothetical protein